jgi:NAD(P)-dependent dehydrogenase (short-subunit alcohol dehydrogenase family)
MKNVKRHVLIVGGSSDIGIEVVKSFLNLNWNVSAHYSKSNKKLKILKQKSKNLKLIQFNFLNYNSSRIEYLIKKKFNNKCDSIVNLIGYIDNKSFRNTNLKSVLKSLTINALIPILINKLLIQKMLKQKFGRILNCSSIGVKFGGGSQTYNYTLAKHCLEFIPAVYKEWAKKNVLINNLRIGITNTKIHKRIKNKNMKKRINLIPIKRMAEPKEISNYIVNLVSDKNSYMTGQTISISGGE